MSARAGAIYRNQSRCLMASKGCFLFLMFQVLSVAPVIAHGVSGSIGHSDARSPEIGETILRELGSEPVQKIISTRSGVDRTQLRRFRFKLSYRPEDPQGGIVGIHVDEPTNDVEIRRVERVFAIVQSYVTFRLKGHSPNSARASTAAQK